MLKKWRTLDSKLIPDTGYFKLFQETCETHTGRVIDDYYIFHNHDVAIIFALTPEKQVVVVRQRPPADIVERIPPQPSRNHVWTAGYWHAQHDQWVWVSGAWVLPPRPNAVYVKPHWEPSGTEFHFSVGVWK